MMLVKNAIKYPDCSKRAYLVLWLATSMTIPAITIIDIVMMSLSTKSIPGVLRSTTKLDAF